MFCGGVEFSGLWGREQPVEILHISSEEELPESQFGLLILKLVQYLKGQTKSYDKSKKVNQILLQVCLLTITSISRPINYNLVYITPLLLVGILI